MTRSHPETPAPLSPLRSFVAGGALALLAGCTPLTQYRDLTDVIDPDTGDMRAECADPANSPDDRCSIERRSYRLEGGEARHYYFAVVEFDDQGWFWDRRQLEALLRFLWTGPGTDDGGDYLILAFAHGWQHNAGGCDNNVVCFQRLLERLDLTERAFNDEANRQIAEANRQIAEDNRRPGALRKPMIPQRRARTVVGLYMGWRGRSSKIPRARALTFWNRKRAGRRVGSGGINELLTRVNDFRRFQNEERAGSATQLLIIGHSFGGLVVHQALAHNLVERAVAMKRSDEPSGPVYGYDVASSFGDLVVLVNPAFEGAAFEPLQFAATNRCFPARQRPALLVVTSQTDSATKTVFPLGRYLSNAFTRGRKQPPGVRQRSTVLGAVGHLDRYRTHTLRLLEGSQTDDRPRKQKVGPCGCPFLPETRTLSVPELGVMRQTPRAGLGPEEMTARDQRYFAWIRLVKDRRGADGGVRENVPAGQTVYELDPATVERDTYGWPIGVSPLASPEAFRVGSYGDDHRNREMVLERAAPTAGAPPTYAANYPYLVVSATPNFIPGHSTIYGQRFTDFVRRFYFRHLASQLNFPEECFGPGRECTETAVTPCGRSSRCRVRGAWPAACPAAY